MGVVGSTVPGLLGECVTRVTRVIEKDRSVELRVPIGRSWVFVTSVTFDPDFYPCKPHDDGDDLGFLTD